MDVVFPGPTSWDELRAVPSGTGQWNGSDTFTLTQCNGGACASPSGSMGFTMNIDFANKTIGGTCGGLCRPSAITVFASDSNLPLGSVSDAISIGQASFSSLTGAATLPFVSNSGNLNAAFSINNLPGLMGHAATVSAVFNDGLNIGAGSATGVRIDCSKAPCGGGL